MDGWMDVIGTIRYSIDSNRGCFVDRGWGGGHGGNGERYRYIDIAIQCKSLIESFLALNIDI